MNQRSRWPDAEKTREFVDMVRSANPAAFVCFEYHDGESALTTKALRSAIEWLAGSTRIMMAIDLEHSVVIASGALSALDEDTATRIVQNGLEDFAGALARRYPEQVAMARIDRKGRVQLAPIIGV